MTRLLALALLPLAAACAELEPTITIAELVADPLAYDGQVHAVGGQYSNIDVAMLDCEPTGTGDDPVVEEGSYTVWPSTWGLQDGNDVLGVEVIDSSGAQTSTRPDYADAEELVLEGTLRYGLVTDDCDLDTQRHSLYLEVAIEDVAIEEKGEPDPPQDG